MLYKLEGLLNQDAKQSLRLQLEFESVQYILSLKKFSSLRSEPVAIMVKIAIVT